MKDPFQHHILSKHMPCRAAACMPHINDEIAATLETVLDDGNASWTEVPIFAEGYYPSKECFCRRRCLKLFITLLNYIRIHLYTMLYGLFAQENCVRH